MKPLDGVTDLGLGLFAFVDPITHLKLDANENNLVVDRALDLRLNDVEQHERSVKGHHEPHRCLPGSTWAADR
ncbi:MAG: hypothetical protein HYV07_00095 [Deltaproteobacteria bacterium]|nr:hypothetical protein [Deltaproteobacteria bacterium]